MKPHPLWEAIRAIDSQSSLPSLDSKSLGAHLAESGHPHLNDLRAYLEEGAIALLIALGAETARFSEELREIRRFILSSRVGISLGMAAREAHWKSQRSRAAFTASTALPGFMEAVTVWSNLVHGIDTEFGGLGDWRILLKKTLKGSGESKEHDDYWLTILQAEAGDGREFAKQQATEIQRIESAAKKRESRGLAPMKSRFKPALTARWLTDALWCRTTAGLLGILAPETTQGASDMAAIDKDISRLGFAKFRRPEHEIVVEEAENYFT